MSAWIEITYLRRSRYFRLQSHSSWVRGLKCEWADGKGTEKVSHSSWVRGLKSRKWNVLYRQFSSHSSWVRGLKSSDPPLLSIRTDVALLVSAWIEIGDIRKRDRCKVSHSSWVRGLKSITETLDTSTPLSHSSWVRGLKFWFLKWYLYSYFVALLVSAWIEIRIGG